MNNNPLKISQSQLGERLKTARINSGLTQDQVAHQLNIARTTLITIEKGSRKISGSELRAFARIYKQPINKFLQTEEINLNFVGRFRQQAKGAKVQENTQAVLDKLNRFASATIELEQALGLRHSANLPPKISIEVGKISDLAEDAALLVRQHVGIGLSPIPDIVTLLEIEFRIRVFLTPLSGSISGAFAFDDKAGACIILNSSHPKTRQNSSAVHELGHIVGSRDDIEVNEDGFIQDSREERFANAFSAAFLMPASWVRRQFSEIKNQSGKFSPRDLIFLSQSAYVSPEAMCRRLEQLELLKKGMWESLKDRGFNSEFVKSINGKSSLETVSYRPCRLMWLVANALEKGLISEGQIVERLGLDRIQIREILDKLSWEGGSDLETILP